MKYSCITDYKNLDYSNANWHSIGNEKSDNKEQILSSLINILNQKNWNLVNIGRENQYLLSQIRKNSIKALTVGNLNQESTNPFEFQLTSCNSEPEKTSIYKAIKKEIGSQWLATCFDTAEHIDIEHLSNFFKNLRALVSKHCIISISTCPSTKFNRYNSSLLPLKTWVYLLNLYGFSVEYSDYFIEDFCAFQDFHSQSDIEELKKWFNINPFKEHQKNKIFHYLQITKLDHPHPNADIELNAILDIDYRTTKRQMIKSNNIEGLPKSVFLVSCIQDWIFLSSLLDVYNKDNLRIIIFINALNRSDLKAIISYLKRVNLSFHSISNHGQINDLLADLKENNFSKIIAVADGNVSHIEASNLIYQARKMGFLTLNIVD